MKNNLKALLQNEDKVVSVLANASSFIFYNISDVSWVGFYLLEDETLYLGPFQGKIACSKININRGVCGESARTLKTVVVKNVEEYPDHIACDSLSKSEIVVPIIIDNKLFAVLDIDSYTLNRFSCLEIDLIKDLASIIQDTIKYIIKGC